jgi:hypothetical protein
MSSSENVTKEKTVPGRICSMARDKEADPGCPILLLLHAFGRHVTYNAKTSNIFLKAFTY